MTCSGNRLKRCYQHVCIIKTLHLARYCSSHSNIKFISSLQRVIPSIYLTLECRNYVDLLLRLLVKNMIRLNIFTAKGTHKTLATALHVLQNMYDFVISCSVILQRTAKKCTKTHNARAESLFCSLTLLFSDFLVAVVVVVYQKSLI